MSAVRWSGRRQMWPVAWGPHARGGRGTVPTVFVNKATAAMSNGRDDLHQLQWNNIAGQENVNRP
jgi:hypothetical protein